VKHSQASVSEGAAFSLSSEEREHLVYAFRRIFEPLASILLRAGVRYHEFRDILQAAYIEAAIRDLPPDYREPKPSTVALAHTIGIPVASIEYLLNNVEILSAPTETNTALIGAILAKWSTEPAFLGPYGLPRQLALAVPAESNFADLVRSVSSDADPAEILETMLTNGSVERVGPTFVKTTGRNLVYGHAMKANQYESLGRLMRDLAATLDRNQGDDQTEKLFQREVFGNHPLPKSRLLEFSELTRNVMHSALVEIDDWLSKAADPLTKEQVVDVGVAIFEFRRTASKKEPLKLLVKRKSENLIPWKNSEAKNSDSSKEPA
jgi:Family of unknown function (DUF6502)